MIHDLVQTRVLAATGTSSGWLEEAVEHLRRGDLVAVPTETVYGLAADARNPLACAAIFEAKGRPLSDPLIVHVPDAHWAERLAVVHPLALKLMETWWPGPLTLVLPKRDSVPDLVTGGQQTVAIRQSAHPILERILQTFDGPVAAPSANRFGRISPTRADHVMDELGGRIPLIIDGGACVHGLESTIVEVGTDTLRILRSGPVTADELSTLARVISPDSPTPVTPGSMKSHYAPATPLQIVSMTDVEAMPESDRKQCGLLAPTKGRFEGFAHVAILSEADNAREMAANLFSAMRLLDGCGAQRILALPVTEEGIGAAIMERLRKAAANE